MEDSPKAMAAAVLGAERLRAELFGIKSGAGAGCRHVRGEVVRGGSSGGRVSAAPMSRVPVPGKE